MAIYRVVKDKDNNYIMMNKCAIYDNDLSFKAKGILTYCLSRPDDWEFHDNEIIRHAKDGIDSTRTGIKELIDAKYIRKITSRDEKGKFLRNTYEIYEKPYEDSTGGNQNKGKSIKESNLKEKNFKENFNEDKSHKGKLPRVRKSKVKNASPIEGKSTKEEEISLVENPLMDNSLFEANQIISNMTFGVIPKGQIRSEITLEETSKEDNPTLLNKDNTNIELLINDTTTTSSCSGGYEGKDESILGAEGLEDKSIKACKYYEKAGFSTVNSIILEKIGALVEIYTYEWVIDAMDVAVLNNRRTLNYVEGILRNWRANGRKNLGGDLSSPNIFNEKWRMENGVWDGRGEKVGVKSERGGVMYGDYGNGGKDNCPKGNGKAAYGEGKWITKCDDGDLI